VPAPFPGWEENGWRLYRSDAATAEDDPVATHQFARADQPAPEGHAPAHLPEGHDVAWSEAGEPSLVKAAEPAEPAFKEEGWNLYSKDEGEGDNAQRIFFFSRESPEDAVPAEVPEGYEVAVNPETGRPFLRRIQDADPDAPIESAHPAVDPAVAGRKRVRIVRVRAADRDAAQRKLEGEGRHVLATMPIDIEKRVQ
jgi:hypothetical protein